MSTKDDAFYFQSLVYLSEISMQKGDKKQARAYIKKAIAYLDKDNRYNQVPGLYQSLKALANPIDSNNRKKKLKDYRFRSIQRLGFNSGLPENTITDISIDNKIVWIGTYNAGLYRLHSEKNIVERIKFPTDFIRNISSVGDQLFIATYDGIFITNKQRIRAKQIKKGAKRFSLAQNILIDKKYLRFHLTSRCN